MRKIKKDECNTLVAAGAVALILTTATPVAAQTQPQPADHPAAKVKMEEVIVTARKRDENLQTVPVAVTAISAEELREKAISAPSDLQNHTPGLELRPGGGQQRNAVQFFLRGQGTTFGSAPGVVTYFSDAPVGNSPKVSIGNNGQFFDLSSVQVLKGPQGTLFGKNTTGGAVLFTPEHPGNEFGGFLQAKAGNYDMREYTGAVTVPLIDGILSVRAAGNIIRRDGFTTSLTTGQVLDDRHRDSYRLGISFTPTQWFDNYTMYQRNKVDENNSGSVLFNFNESNALYNTTPVNLATFNPLTDPVTGFVAVAGLCGGIYGATPAAGACVQTRLGILNSLRNGLIAEENRINNGGDSAKRKNVTDDILTFTGENEQLNNITKINLGTLGWLGDMSIKNVFNSVKNDGVHTKYDGGSPLPNGLVYNNYDSINGTQVATSKSDGSNDWFDDYSEEIQILGTIAEKHTWIAGYYRERDYDKLDYPPLFSAYGNAFSPNLLPAVVASFSHNSLNLDTGYFIQGTADLSVLGLEGLKLTYGWRHSKSSFEGDQQGYDTLAYLTQGTLTPNGIDVARPKVQDEADTHNIGLDYQITPDMLLYVASRTGFKPGGANIAPSGGVVVPSFTPNYGPEKVEDVEFGMKADWDIAGRPLRTNVAAYRTWYNDIQRSESFATAGGVPFTQTANIAKARIDGLELEAIFQATDYLRISLNYAWMNAKYLKWPGTTTTVLTGETKELADSPYVGTPKNQGTLSLRYTLPTPAEWGEIAATANYYAQSSVHLNDTELADGFGKQSGWSNLNLRLDWANVVGAPVDLALFVTNATDGLHAVALNSFYPFVGTANAIYNEPRMWGAEVRYRFGSNAKK
ncbi:MAG: hypothetical protein JWM78_2620 [Verrucomicrobiaceae bacterium]|nr:hypothetical protein [Verrucomicrobiaceae bacterium]